jgi:hypothetical protein
MSISNVNKPFKAVKEMHIATIQALIDVYSKIGSFVADRHVRVLLQKTH